MVPHRAIVGLRSPIYDIRPPPRALQTTQMALETPQMAIQTPQMAHETPQMALQIPQMALRTQKISPFYRTSSPIGAAVPLQPNYVWNIVSDANMLLLDTRYKAGKGTADHMMPLGNWL